MSKKLGRIVYKLRWFIIIASFILVAGMISGLPKLHFSNNYRNYFDPDDPDLVAHETFQDVYGQEDSVLVKWILMNSWLLQQGRISYIEFFMWLDPEEF